MEEAVRLWDTVLSELDPSDPEPFILYVGVAMLIFLREALLAGDFGENMRILARFPPVPADQLVASAKALRDTPVLANLSARAERMAERLSEAERGALRSGLQLSRQLSAQATEGDARFGDRASQGAEKIGKVGNALTKKASGVLDRLMFGSKDQTGSPSSVVSKGSSNHNRPDGRFESS